MLFSLLAAPFYVPTNSVQGFQFLHVVANTCYFVIFFSSLTAILMGYEVGSPHRGFVDLGF